MKSKHKTAFKTSMFCKVFMETKTSVFVIHFSTQMRSFISKMTITYNLISIIQKGPNFLFNPFFDLISDIRFQIKTFDFNSVNICFGPSKH